MSVQLVSSSRPTYTCMCIHEHVPSYVVRLIMMPPSSSCHPRLSPQLWPGWNVAR